MAELAFTVDWLNYTAFDTRKRTIFELAHKLPGDTVVVAKPSNGYNRAFENRAGARLQFHTDRYEMHHHISYSGKTLNNYGREGITPRQIAQHHAVYGDVCKRIDLALDARDTNLSIASLWRLRQIGAYTGTAKQYSFIESQSGLTLYIGSRTSEQYLRIYDKAAEQGLDQDWKRIELELKGSRANQIARYLVTNSESALGERTRELVKHLIDFNDATWANIVGKLAVGISKAKEGETDTASWILGQVAPAVGRFMARTGNTEILEQMLTVISAYYEQGVKARQSNTDLDKFDNP